MNTGISEIGWADPVQIIARAKADGRTFESMDPDRLILFVEQFLIDRGLHPDRGGHHKMAQTAACQLLRALGIVPAVAPQDAIDRHNAAYADYA